MNVIKKRVLEINEDSLKRKSLVYLYFILLERFHKLLFLLCLFFLDLRRLFVQHGIYRALVSFFNLQISLRLGQIKLGFGFFLKQGNYFYYSPTEFYRFQAFYFFVYPNNSALEMAQDLTSRHRRQLGGKADLS